MADDCLDTLMLWGLGIFGIFLFAQYILIPYWYVFVAIALIAAAFWGGNVYLHQHAEQQKALVQSRIKEFPQNYSTDVSDLMLALNNSGAFSDTFDQAVDDYLIHRELLAKESERLNHLAEKYKIAERIKYQNKSA